VRNISYRFANRIEALLIRSNDLLMGVAVLLTVSGMMITMMVMREELDWMLLLGWIPVGAFFAYQLGMGDDLRERHLAHLARDGFRIDDEIIGPRNGVAFDTVSRRIALIPYTRTGTPGVYGYDDVDAVRYDYRDGPLGRVEQCVTFRLKDPASPDVKVDGGEAVYSRISALLQRTPGG